MDANIHPDVCLLVMQLSKYLNVNAKVGWSCLLRRSVGIWVPELCYTIWTPPYCSFWVIILDSLQKPEHVFIWGAAVTLGSYCFFSLWPCNEALLQQIHPCHTLLSMLVAMKGGENYKV